MWPLNIFLFLTLCSLPVTKHQILRKYFSESNKRIVLLTFFEILQVCKIKYEDKSSGNISYINVSNCNKSQITEIIQQTVMFIVNLLNLINDFHIQKLLWLTLKLWTGTITSCCCNTWNTRLGNLYDWENLINTETVILELLLMGPVCLVIYTTYSPPPADTDTGNVKTHKLLLETLLFAFSPVNMNLSWQNP